MEFPLPRADAEHSVRSNTSLVATRSYRNLHVGAMVHRYSEIRGLGPCSAAPCHRVPSRPVPSRPIPSASQLQQSLCGVGNTPASLSPGCLPPRRFITGRGRPTLRGAPRQPTYKRERRIRSGKRVSQHYQEATRRDESSFGYFDISTSTHQHGRVLL